MRVPRRALYAAALSLSATTPGLLPGWRIPPAHAVVELSDEQQLVVDAWAVVQRAYVDPGFNGVDWKAVRTDYVKRPYKGMKAARKGVDEMLALLGDRYTRYVTPAGREALLARFERKDSDGGIGVTLGERRATGATDGGVKVLSVSTGSPADKAGMRTGDVVVGVNGRRASSSAEEVAALILGPIDEPLALDVRSADSTEPRELALRRAPLESGAVTAKLITRAGASTVGVVSIPLFVDGSAWFDSLVRALDAVSAADVWLLDLRGNIGGHFPTGVNAARLFLANGVTIVSTLDRNGAGGALETTSAGKYALSPAALYVLVDKGSASAAEVFAAALQDNGRAKVVGETSFGKGLVQTIARVSDGGAVVCTTARYLTPRGRDINGRGVVPDVLVPAPCTSKSPDGAVECLERSGALTPPA